MSARPLALALAVVGAAIVRVPHAVAQVPALTLDSTYGCLACHAPERRSFIAGVHAERGIRCADCHGGDPSAFELPQGHARPFLGRPDKLAIAELCATCHADPAQMRRYGLPADQLAGLRASRHGQLLDRGDRHAPTCTDCHEAHLIRRATDARSRTYPLNIPETCAACHTDAAVMEPYGIGTDQYDAYRASAHGVDLFEAENFASPTCVGCHGSHAALPPGVTEVAEVCGQCHQLVRQALARGPHGSSTATREMKGCLGCHANHATERVPRDSLAATCATCHDGEDAALAVARDLSRQLHDAEIEIERAAEALHELAESGYETADARFRFVSARTNYLQMSVAQHALDLETVDDLLLRVRSTTGDIVEAAEVAGEHRWERKLVLIPVWFLTLAVLIGVGFRLNELRHGG